MLPGFARVDAALFWRPAPRCDLALHVENALDRRSFLGGTTGATLEPAAPRVLTLRSGWRW